MSGHKLGRIPSMRERVEGTLSAHRNELVALLSRYMNLIIFFGMEEISGKGLNYIGILSY